MFIVMGATGHVGSAVAKTLLRRGQPVTIVTHDPAHGADWTRSGAEVAIADIGDVAALTAAFRRGSRAFLLNPPADTRLDTDAIETRTAANIVAALDGSGLEKIVAESTAGAMPGKGIGDSSVLWGFEQALARQPIPAAINRAAFYMSNWDAQLATIRSGGQLQTMYPTDFALPMVAPDDAGEMAADRLMAPIDDVAIRYVEGPARYTSAEVAAAFAAALGRTVETVTTPPDQLRDAYRKLGFSDAAADAYARMTEETMKSDFAYGDAVMRGTTTLRAYVDDLVAAASDA